MASVEPRPVRSAAGFAAERLYREHGERVRAICGSILRNRQEAEDAAQQVFVSALRALHSGVEPRDAGAWLATIARRESWARARRDAPPVRLVEELEDPAQEDPATTVARRTELADAWQTIAELPPAQRTALLLREVRGLGYGEVADDLSVSRASVRSLLARARRTLRMQLEKGAAALTGAPWVSVLARVFGDASTPAVSSATRTAAVGLGALVVTSGAVVAPTLAHHGGAARRPAVRSERAAQRVVPPVVIPHRAAVAGPVTTTTRHAGVGSARSDRGRHAERGPVTEDRSGRTASGDGGHGTSSGTSSGSGEGPRTSGDSSASQPTVAVVGTSTDGPSGSTSGSSGGPGPSSGTDGGGSLSSGGTDGSSGGTSGSSGSDGSSGSGQSEDGH